MTELSDFTDTDKRVLHYLRAHADVTQADFCNWFQVDRFSAKRKLDPLEAAGLVIRRRCPNDERVIRYNLTRAAFSLFHDTP